MKKILITAIAMLSVCLQLSAQSEAQEYKARYERQVKNVGICGVGVETIIDAWEAADPEDEDMLYARFLYCFNKAKYQEIVSNDNPKYLGMKPVLTLKDSLGRDVYYFQETMFDPEYYERGSRAIDELVRRKPLDLKYRLAKTSALQAYEKEDVVLTTIELEKLVNENAAHAAWTYEGRAIDPDEFATSIQAFCIELYNVGSKSSLESFRKVSEMMVRQFPGNTEFIDNIGTWWMIVPKNYKKAISFYNKALKINPQDQMALANRKIAEKKMSASKKK